MPKTKQKIIARQFGKVLVKTESILSPIELAMLRRKGFCFVVNDGIVRVPSINNIVWFSWHNVLNGCYQVYTRSAKRDLSCYFFFSRSSHQIFHKFFQFDFPLQRCLLTCTFLFYRKQKRNKFNGILYQRCLSKSIAVEMCVVWHVCVIMIWWL